MKFKSLATLAIAFALASINQVKAQETPNTRSMTLFDAVVFYDGYQGTVIDADVDDGILRHRNSLYAKKLTDEQLDWFGNKVTVNITVGALCDNYDRIGNINIALVPKGAESYDPFSVSRLELCRFITPFMDKNKQPDEVPYTFELDDLCHIFHDARVRAQYDYWIEFELFGIPYAANEQIEGCAGRNDVFTGTLEFVTSETPAANSENEVLVPIVMKKPEYMGHNLNNYSEAGTDTLGVCTKTYRFNVPEGVQDGQVVFIISNHGANANGEEYVRRLHLLYYDEELIQSYKPGGESCEPYRVYNTQPNGIYANKRTEKFWQTYSNWCPGAAIPVRYLKLQGVEPGEHKVMIRVPKAKFVDQQGDFPVSMYFQGLKEGYLAELEAIETDTSEIELQRTGDRIRFITDKQITEVSLISYDGREVYNNTVMTGEIDLSSYPAGIYVLCLYRADGVLESIKLAK